MGIPFTKRREKSTNLKDRTLETRSEDVTIKVAGGEGERQDTLQSPERRERKIYRILKTRTT